MAASTTPDPSGARLRVGYLGPEGTFSEEALLADSSAEEVQPVPLASIYETVRALREGEVTFAIVPIENSLDGSVTVTLDLLAHEEDITIVGESRLRVRHALIASGHRDLDSIDTVLTHPVVPGQCALFLHSELARARVLPAASTAEAVRTVVHEDRPGMAAIGTALAAEIYGGTILRAGIEDREDNETRFVWLARADGDPRAPLRPAASGDAEKTSLVFSGEGASGPGWLVRCLQEFASRGINLTKIESRPTRERLGSYMFFADLQGGAQEPHVAEAIAGARELCDQLRVLGSYRAAAPAR